MKDIPFDIQFAGVSTPFNLENMPTLKTMVKAVQNDLRNLASRLSNLQRMM